MNNTPFGAEYTASNGVIFLQKNLLTKTSILYIIIATELVEI